MYDSFDLCSEHIALGNNISFTCGSQSSYVVTGPPPTSVYESIRNHHSRIAALKAFLDKNPSIGSVRDKVKDLRYLFVTLTSPDPTLKQLYCYAHLHTFRSTSFKGSWLHYIRV
jgi:hypothetical protein